MPHHATTLDELFALRDQNKRLRDALVHVRKIVVEAAETGFNCHDGDWADRLFASQAMTHAALSHPNQTDKGG